MKIPTIESGIPMPERRRFGGPTKGQSKKQLFLKALQIGDSFASPDDHTANNWATTARKIGLRLASRKIDDKTVRLWRIA